MSSSDKINGNEPKPSASNTGIKNNDADFRTVRELAQRLGISQRRLYIWFSHPTFPTHTKAPWTEVDAKAIDSWRDRELSPKKASASLNERKLRAELIKARTERLRLENRMRRGELLERTKYEAKLIRLLHEFRNDILAFARTHYPGNPEEERRLAEGLEGLLRRFAEAEPFRKHSNDEAGATGDSSSGKAQAVSMGGEIQGAEMGPDGPPGPVSQ